MTQQASRAAAPKVSHDAPVRRIVTGVDHDGRSRIEADGPSPSVIRVEARPGYQVVNLWRTTGPDQRIDAADTIADHVGIRPPQGGSVLRIIDFPPDIADEAERKAALAKQFATLWADAQHNGEEAPHPGMHVTDTVDYAIMISGELVAILDTQETVMRAGDVLIQRGTNHAWANRSGAPARIAFVLLHATR